MATRMASCLKDWCVEAMLDSCHPRVAKFNAPTQYFVALTNSPNPNAQNLDGSGTTGIDAPTVGSSLDRLKNAPRSISR